MVLLVRGGTVEELTGSGATLALSTLAVLRTTPILEVLRPQLAALATDVHSSRDNGRVVLGWLWNAASRHRRCQGEGRKCKDVTQVHFDD